MGLGIRAELELELIQSYMAQKPMMRGEAGARALRVRSDVRGDGQVRLCNALGCGERVVLWSRISYWWRPPRGVVQWHRVTPIGVGNSP